MAKRYEYLGASVGHGGWVRFSVGGDDPPFLLVRFAIDDIDELAPVELYLDGALTETMLHSLPLKALRDYANAPSLSPHIRAYISLPGPDLRRAARHYSAGSWGPAAFDRESGRGKNWVVEMWAAQIKGSGIPQAPLPRVPDDEYAPELPDCRLELPTGKAFPHDFYRRVGALVTELRLLGVRPASRVIAEANGVSVDRVNKWIHKAIELGFLPSSRRSK